MMVITFNNVDLHTSYLLDLRILDTFLGNFMANSGMTIAFANRFRY
jgi:hypothetical protein